jgi:hypothetical protein
MRNLRLHSGWYCCVASHSISARDLQLKTALGQGVGMVRNISTFTLDGSTGQGEKVGLERSSRERRNVDFILTRDLGESAGWDLHHGS